MALKVFTSNNVQVQYEETNFSATELPTVKRRAMAMPNSCEADFAALCGWFGLPVRKGFGPSNRVFVTLDGKIRGASNSGYSTTNSKMTVNVLAPTDDAVLSLFVAEMIEILMSYPG